jgi:hypothetical protein
MRDTRSASRGPVIVQPVASRIASLPPVWSGCQWVFQTWVICQPRAVAAASTGSATDGSTATVSPEPGSCISQT